MSSADFDYAQAFSRNIGLISEAEQQRLRNAVIALPGLGGVGGTHLLALTRMGFGRFRIADGDRFELQNFNRQVGATLSSIGASKVQTMAAAAKDINPELAIEAYDEPVGAHNLDAFLQGADIVIDGLDFFCFEARRMVFNRARELKIPVITCGPMGFSVATLLFMPDGPSFDEFFDIRANHSPEEQLLRFGIGLAPAALQIPYMDPGSVSLGNHCGPSSVIATQLCGSVAAMEAVNLILKRRKPWAVPGYSQFDVYRMRFKRGRLIGGNRNPVQRAKLWYVRRLLKSDFQKQKAA